MLLVSCGAVALVYLVSEKLFDERIALVAMALTAVNPWQFMQSRWSLDCNLFPHVFLLAFYLLLLGLEKRRYLYLSMLFFGLTFYCYGIAAYSVTAFLFVFFIWCLWKKQLKFREGLLCAVIFTLVALPEVIVLGINALHLGMTVETPFFTMPYFPDSVRSADILLLNFSLAQLGRNAWALISHVFLQLPDIFFNSIRGIRTYVSCIDSLRIGRDPNIHEAPVLGKGYEGTDEDAGIMGVPDHRYLGGTDHL